MTQTTAIIPVEKLRNIFLFSNLSEGMLKSIATATLAKETSKGEMIFFEGQEGENFYAIIKGVIKIFKLTASGNEQILHIFGEGDIFGEVAVFSGETFPASAKTLENSSLLVFPRAHFIALLQKEPTLSLNMLAILSTRLRRMTALVENVSLKSVSGRLVSYLLDIDDGQGKWVTLTISKQQLAKVIGTIPETLSRTLRRLQEQGLMEVAGKRVRLVDYTALEDIASGETR